MSVTYPVIVSAPLMFLEMSADACAGALRIFIELAACTGVVIGIAGIDVFADGRPGSALMPCNNLLSAVVLSF